MSRADDIRQFVNNNISLVTDILDDSRREIVNSTQVKTLSNKYLEPYLRRRVNKSLYFAIRMKEEDILKIKFDNVELQLSNEVNECLKKHNYVTVDNDFNLVDSEWITLNQNFLEDESQKGYVIFFLGDKRVDIASRGKIIDKFHTFYNEEDKARYFEKYHISQLEDCLKEYERSHITDPGINPIFFAKRASINRIKSNCSEKNILINKPESQLRDNLLLFLNTKTQHTFTKENELNSQRELDLYTEVEGKTYLIEVKWLGQCINDDESDFTQKVTDYSARDGVKQTVQYIYELIERMGFNLHCGYLCVFDAREVKKDINYENYSIIFNKNPTLIPYFSEHFVKLPEIKLDNLVMA